MSPVSPEKNLFTHPFNTGRRQRKSALTVASAPNERNIPRLKRSSGKMYHLSRASPSTSGTNDDPGNIFSFDQEGDRSGTTAQILMS